VKIFCCGCNKEIEARLTNGKEVYAHRKDLYDLPFWICDTCRNFVGCHHKTTNRTNPLGIIATKEIKSARIHIHALIDPVWKSKKMKRGVLYANISEKLGYSYHTSNIKSIEEARRIYRIAREIRATN